MRTKCKMCYKMVFWGKGHHSEEKLHPTEAHSFKSSIPGLSKTSQEMKPTDNNLSPFQICNLKPIQYGDTLITSISTEDPRWSPGKCLNISKYQGIFRKNKCLMNSKVIS